MKSELKNVTLRNGLVSLWDVVTEREVGVGRVEHTTEIGALCRHRWVLDHGYKFLPSGLRYKPVAVEVDFDVAERTLVERWTPDSRLVVCEARTLDIPAPAFLRAERPTSGDERIDHKGVWPIFIEEIVAGYIFVPEVQTFKSAPSSDAQGDPAGLLPGNDTSLGLQNRYVEHWVLLDQAFPLLSREVVVAARAGQWTPDAESFFRDAALRAGGSYTEVRCATYVQAPAS